MKDISEATVREIESYKKQLKQKDERINALESAEPRVVEKLCRSSTVRLLQPKTG